MRNIWLIALIATIIVAVNLAFGQSELFKVTTGMYSDTVDLNQAVKNEFGNEYRVADWNDIKNYNGGNTQYWANGIGMNHGDYYFVTWNGQSFYGGNRHYFITRFDGTVDSNYLVHDQLGNNLITLGSWYGIQERVLAFRNPQSPPQQISVWTDKSVYNQGESPTITYSLDKWYYGAIFYILFPDGQVSQAPYLGSGDANQGINSWTPYSTPGAMTNQVGQYKVTLLLKDHNGLDQARPVATTYYTVISSQPIIQTQQPTQNTNCPSGMFFGPREGKCVPNDTPGYL